ncbi:MAG: hypothetical protein R2710_05250 [Acidimicrobiales bacterium]
MGSAGAAMAVVKGHADIHTPAASMSGTTARPSPSPSRPVFSRLDGSSMVYNNLDPYTPRPPRLR